jgi:hypothetical protein
MRRAALAGQFGDQTFNRRAAMPVDLAQKRVGREIIVRLLKASVQRLANGQRDRIDTAPAAQRVGSRRRSTSRCGRPPSRSSSIRCGPLRCDAARLWRSFRYASAARPPVECASGDRRRKPIREDVGGILQCLEQLAPLCQCIRGLSLRLFAQDRRKPHRTCRAFAKEQLGEVAT